MVSAIFRVVLVGKRVPSALVCLRSAAANPFHAAASSFICENRPWSEPEPEARQLIMMAEATQQGEKRGGTFFGLISWL